jgi:hypothetical protein
MKTHLSLLAITLGITLATVHAQPIPGVPTGQARPGPEFNGYLPKFFADNPAYTANLEFHSYPATSGNAVTVQGKIAYLNGRTRFEMNMSDAGDANLPRQDASSLTQMGMNTMIAISCPDRKVNYFIYPGMKAYVRRPIPALETAATAAEYSLDANLIGYENVLGQSCVKNKVVATGPDGIPHDSNIWSAIDNNNFPIKIETVQDGAAVILLFRDVTLGAPDAAQFEPPADYKRYDSFMGLMVGSAGTQAPQ